MARGGKREGAGRKPGSVTKRTREIADAVAESGLTPLDYLLSILRDETQTQEERKDAAKSAAPYCHARLNAVDANVDGKMVVGVAGYPGIDF